MMRKAVFQVDDHALAMKYYDLIDIDLRENIHQKVLEFRFKQVLPKMMIRAVFSQFYCSHCVSLLIDKKELKKHMLQMHRSDVLTQHRRPNTEENEEQRLLRLIKRSKLRRWLYGTLRNDELVNAIRLANELTMSLVNYDNEEETEIRVHEQEPIPETRF